MSEKEGSVVFRRHNRVMDYITLFGIEEKLRKWCKDFSCIIGEELSDGIRVSNKITWMLLERTSVASRTLKV